MPELSLLGLAASFAAGVISFLSPCVLPLVPGYLSYVAGHSLDPPSGSAGLVRRLRILRLALCFVLGFSTVFIAFGASATALGQLLLSYRYQANIVGGGIVILFGLVMTGLVRPSWLERDIRLHLDIPGGRAVAAYVLGISFAFGWTPCIGPVLGAILTASAMTATVSKGVALLSIYSLGLGLPFIVTAIFLDGAVGRLGGLRRAGRWLQLGAGLAVIGTGVAIQTGELSTFSYWLLETIPGLASLG